MTELFGVEIVIETTPADQILMITAFSDLTILNDEDLISRFDG